MESTLDHALRYIARGWSVIPLRPRDKRPAVKLEPFLAGDRRIDTREAAGWWSDGMPVSYGIGIVTGAPSGIVVVDVDPRNGGSNEDTLRDAPTNCVAVTGSGGMHLFFRHPSGKRVPCGKSSRVGVDRKADGGYVVAAPSLHPDTGDAYYWLSDEGDPPPLPSWVLDAPSAAPGGMGEDRGPWVSDVLENPASCTPGEQEDTLTRLTYYAARHWPQDIGETVIWNWLRQVPLGNPHDPWTREHVVDRLERACRKIAAEPKAFDAVLPDSKQRSTSKPTLDALREKLRTPNDVTTTEQDQLDWIVEDFLAPGAYTELIGAVKEGKTTLMCDWFRAIISSESWLDRTTTPTDILYVTEQMGASLKATLERAHLDGIHDRIHILTIADILGIPWLEAVAAIVEIAKERGCGVIAIDTLQRLAGVEDEDSSGQALQALQPFVAAKAANIAVLFLRHARKSGGTVNAAGRGSSAVTGEMDVVCYMTAPEGGDHDFRHLEWISRISETGDMDLEYEHGTFHLATETPKQARTKERARSRREHRHAPIIQCLAGSVAPVSWQTLLDATGKSKAALSRNLKELIALGRVQHTEDEGYTLIPEEITLEGA